MKTEQGNSLQICDLSDSSEEDLSEVPPLIAFAFHSDLDVQEISSVVPMLKNLATAPRCKSELRQVDYDKVPARMVQFLPSQFGGDILFELPPPISCGGLAGLMQGMNKRHDGHPWCKTKTTNIKNDVHLTFRRSVCVGHMRCPSPTCIFLNHHDSPNDKYWEIVPLNPFHPGASSPPNGTFVCRHCKKVPHCVATCPARMYYVTHRMTLQQKYGFLDL